MEADGDIPGCGEFRIMTEIQPAGSDGSAEVDFGDYEFGSSGSWGTNFDTSDLCRGDHRAGPLGLMKVRSSAVQPGALVAFRLRASEADPFGDKDHATSPMVNVPTSTVGLWEYHTTVSYGSGSDRFELRATYLAKVSKVTGG